MRPRSAVRIGMLALPDDAIEIHNPAGADADAPIQLALGDPVAAGRDSPSKRRAEAVIRPPRVRVNRRQGRRRQSHAPGMSFASVWALRSWSISMCPRSDMSTDEAPIRIGTPLTKLNSIWLMISCPVSADPSSL